MTEPIVATLTPETQRARMSSSIFRKILCRIGYHDRCGGILPGLFEMQFKEIPGKWWPISSTLFADGYCIYCGDCSTSIFVIPSKDNPEWLQISGQLGDVILKFRERQ